MIEVNIMFILPRLIFINGLLQFNIILLLICILGYFVNVVYVDYASHKRFSSFIEIIVSNKKNLKGVLFFFFFSLCFRKIIFNTVIFAENFLFFKKYYHLNKIGEASFQIIVAIFYFIFIVQFIFLQNMKQLQWISLFVLGTLVVLFCYFVGIYY